MNEFRNKLAEIITKIVNVTKPVGIFMIAISCHGTDNDEILFSDDTRYLNYVIFIDSIFEIFKRESFLNILEQNFWI